MNLIKEQWNNKDISDFNKYLMKYKNSSKVDWTRKSLNTTMPLLAIKTKDIRNIANEIFKGNYISFLDLELDDYYESLAIYGFIITKIKDFNIMKKYLDKYIYKIDNWALCDLLSFNVNNNEDNYFNLSKEYLKNKKPFVRRVGFVILFKFIDNDKYIDQIFKLMNSFYNEKEYYVNMINAWLFCECFIKRKEKTLLFLKDHKLNKFTINKGISKCRDSYRVSIEDKEMLLKYKLLT